MDHSSGPRLSAKHLGSTKPAGLQLDAATLNKLKDQALAKARKLQEQVTYHFSLLDQCSTGLLHPCAFVQEPELKSLTQISDSEVQAAKQTAQNYAHAKLAVQDVASSRDAREAGAKVWTIWKNAEGGSIVLAIARFLVNT